MLELNNHFALYNINIYVDKDTILDKNTGNYLFCLKENHNNDVISKSLSEDSLKCILSRFDYNVVLKTPKYWLISHNNKSLIKTKDNIKKIISDYNDKLLSLTCVDKFDEIYCDFNYLYGSVRINITSKRSISSDYNISFNDNVELMNNIIEMMKHHDYEFIDIHDRGFYMMFELI